MKVKKNFYNIVANNSNVNTNNGIPQKTLEDYLKFFTTPEGTDMTSYIYQDSCNYYDQLIRSSQEYYLCKKHIEIILNYKDKFIKYLDGVTDVIEIGPGTDYVVKNKTMNILSYAKNLKAYHIIDNCSKYLHETSSFIKKYIPEIKIFTIESDLNSEEKINIPHASNGKKCLLLLGGTLANFHENQQDHCLNKIYDMLDAGDIFIVTADTNQDEETLLAAYTNKIAKNLISGVINYFATINPDFSKYSKNFEIQTTWNKIEHFVDISFYAKSSFSFEFPNYGTIMIKKGEIFKGIRAYKRTQQKNIDILNKSGFKIIDVLGDHNNIQEYICTKT